VCLGVGGVAGLHFTLQAQYFVDRALLGIALFGGRDNGFVMLWMRCGTCPGDKGFLRGLCNEFAMAGIARSAFFVSGAGFHSGLAFCDISLCCHDSFVECNQNVFSGDV